MVDMGSIAVEPKQVIAAVMKGIWHKLFKRPRKSFTVQVDRFATLNGESMMLKYVFVILSGHSIGCWVLLQGKIM